MPSTSCVGEDLSVPIGIVDCCAGGESCLALGCGRDERGRLKSCKDELNSRECSVPSTGCVGEGLSVSVCIADGRAGGVSGRTLGCGREDRGELRSCEGELSFSRGGELGIECTVSPRSSVCGDVSVADGDVVWRFSAGLTNASSSEGRPVWEGAETRSWGSSRCACVWLLAIVSVQVVPMTVWMRPMAMMKKKVDSECGRIEVRTGPEPAAMLRVRKST